MAINLANDFQPQAYEVEKKIVVDVASFKKVFGTMRWSPETGQDGSLTQTQPNDPQVKETSSA